MKLLIEGWFDIPHSYAIVNCFQIYALKKKFPDLALFKKETVLFKKEWENKRAVIFPKRYQDVLESIPVHNGEKVDVIYRISFPYNISPPSQDVPVVVFFTSEFRVLSKGYFTGGESSLGFHFVTPSEWNVLGLNYFPDAKCTVITHGVDPGLLYSDDTRESTRAFYGVKPDETLLMSIGSMTENKGVSLVLEALSILVKSGKKYKLLLKGTCDLYNSKEFVQGYFDKLVKQGKLTQTQVVYLYDCVLFVKDTLTFDLMRVLFNACDIYMAPYLAEGFSLTPLEAAACGCKIVLPETGSTSCYADAVGAFKVKSKVVCKNGFYFNEINVLDLVETTTTASERPQGLSKVPYNLTWDFVAQELMELFEHVRLKKTGLFY